MTLQELQNQALQLLIGDRWCLVQLVFSTVVVEFNPTGNAGT